MSIIRRILLEFEFLKGKKDFTNEKFYCSPWLLCHHYFYCMHAFLLDLHLFAALLFTKRAVLTI